MKIKTERERERKKEKEKKREKIVQIIKKNFLLFQFLSHPINLKKKIFLNIFSANKSGKLNYHNLHLKIIFSSFFSVHNVKVKHIQFTIKLLIYIFKNPYLYFGQNISMIIRTDSNKECSQTFIIHKHTKFKNANSF